MKKAAVKSDFELYNEKIEQKESDRLKDYFKDIREHLQLPEEQEEAIVRDFEKAVLYLDKQGLGLNEIMERLPVNKLGGFYVRPSHLWYALDDAAKIYPLAMRHGYMAVFRLSLYLKEQVVPEILQMALTFTIKRFQSFATTVKKGVLWHYLDATKRRYTVEEETDVPLRPIRISTSGSQSFRVLYFNNRVSIEYFHILTDGTGGMVFLKTLMAEYLRLMGYDIPCEEGVLDISAQADEQETGNEFERTVKPCPASGFTDKRAVQFSGALSKIKPCKLIHFKMDADELKRVAKSYDATVTVFMLALMFMAGSKSVDLNHGEINIQVPVNMRKYYPSKTLRNFSLYCGIRIDIENTNDIGAIIESIKKQLKEKASLDAMNSMMNSTGRLVRSVRYIPLIIKEPIAKLVYGILGDKIFTNTLSNIGVIKLPKEMEEYVDSMDFVLGTSLTNRAACSMVTVGNTATWTVSKNTKDPTFEEVMYGLLSDKGINVRIEGSQLYED